MLKVVVIEDNTISRNILTSALLSGGHDVVGGFNTTSAGLASAIKLKPQLICIDIGQTDETGLEKLDTIRTSLPKTLIFLVSGKFDSTTVEAALARGAHGFIVKPFNTLTVLKNIRNTILKMAKQHRQATSTEDGSATTSGDAGEA